MRQKDKKRTGLFFTFEGIDGCGKSTQAALTAKQLTERGYKVRLLREPGSTRTAEKIRRLLLDKRYSITDRTELLLYEAARCEIVDREIKSLLADGFIVLCDRFYDSTTAYQGYGRKLDLKLVRTLHRFATDGLVPDLTLLFDISPDISHQRQSAHKDRLESQSRAFFRRVRQGFLDIARRERRRIKVIDASPEIEVVFAEVIKLLNRKLKLHERKFSRS